MLWHSRHSAKCSARHAPPLLCCFWLLSSTISLAGWLFLPVDCLPFQMTTFTCTTTLKLLLVCDETYILNLLYRMWFKVRFQHLNSHHVTMSFSFTVSASHLSQDFDGEVTRLICGWSATRGSSRGVTGLSVWLLCPKHHSASWSLTLSRLCRLNGFERRWDSSRA